LIRNDHLSEVRDCWKGWDSTIGDHWIRRRSGSGDPNEDRRRHPSNQVGSEATTRTIKVKLDYLFSGIRNTVKIRPSHIIGTPTITRQCTAHVQYIKLRIVLVVETVLVHQWYFHRDAFPGTPAESGSGGEACLTLL